MPHLVSWIDELIAACENSSRSAHPSTENLVHSLKRYDTIFCELMRQNYMFRLDLKVLLNNLNTWTVIWHDMPS